MNLYQRINGADWCNIFVVGDLDGVAHAADERTRESFIRPGARFTYFRW